MEKELIEFGLSKKESEIYIVCLKIGEATANRISSLAGLHRSTTYDILDKLRHNGFITTVVKDKKTYFIANNPRIILTSLNEQKKEFLNSISERKKIFRKLIPEFKQIQNVVNFKPTAEVFEGKVSISKVLDEIVENASYLKIIGNQENALEKIGYRANKFRMRRKERGFKVYQILEDSKEARKEKADKYTEVRFLKSIKNSMDAIFIYNDTTVHLILGHELSIIRIKSKEHTKAQEINFDELWKISKET